MGTENSDHRTEMITKSNKKTLTAASMTFKQMSKVRKCFDVIFRSLIIIITITITSSRMRKIQ